MNTQPIIDKLLPTKMILPLGITVALVLLLSACEKAPEQQGGGFPPPAVSVAKVIEREITPWEEFNGRVEATDTVEIRPRVGGVIEKTHYSEGDMVKQGDLLFVLDQKPFRAELARAEADLARAHAEADLARSEIRRAKNLVTRNLLSQDEYDQRVAAEAQANAKVRSVEATLQLVRLDLAYTEIRAPIDGRTGQALVTKGSLVASDPTPDLLTTVLSVDPVYVVFDIDELTYLRYFKKLQPASERDGRKKRPVFIGLGNEAGFPREGHVNFVDNHIAPDTGTIRVRAILDNAEGQLLPGLFARVKLLAPTSEKALLIADHAILTDQDRKYVYVLGAENKAMRRDIHIGRTYEGLRIVSDGLKPDEQIIVHGIQKVFFPNMPVMPQMIGMSDPAPSPGAMPVAEH